MAKLKLADVAKHYGRPYQEIYQKVVSGLIPAERSENGSRWLINEADLTSIAALLGKKPAVEGSGLDRE